ncbi:DUF5320 domain-containing protein (plasmid) [Chloroflexota bacterium]|nr:DUF5320 domain-containing protein [Chloroflexota bacterium]
MPYQDGTGPEGSGPTGRGLGPCGNGTAQRGSRTFGFGRGRRGRGRGFGIGVGMGRGFVNDADPAQAEKTWLENRLKVVNEILSKKAD